MPSSSSSSSSSANTFRYVSIAGLTLSLSGLLMNFINLHTMTHSSGSDGGGGLLFHSSYLQHEAGTFLPPEPRRLWDEVAEKKVKQKYLDLLESVLERAIHTLDQCTNSPSTTSTSQFSTTTTTSTMTKTTDTAIATATAAGGDDKMEHHNEGAAQTGLRGQQLQRRKLGGLEQQQFQTAAALRRLTPFGIINDLTNYLHTPAIATTETATTSAGEPPRDTLSSSASSSSSCVPPPDTSCGVNVFSVVLWKDPTIMMSPPADAASQTQSKENKNTFRTLVLNAVAILSHSQVTEIIVVLPSESYSSDGGVTTSSSTVLKTDPYYGQRLWSWHENPEHPVRIKFVNTTAATTAATTTAMTATTNAAYMDDLENSAFAKYSVVPRNEAVLFISGNEPWDGSEQSVVAGFELWKRHSRSIVASRGWHVSGLQGEAESSASSVFPRPLKTSENLVPICRTTKFAQQSSPSAAAAAPRGGVTTTEHAVLSDLSSSSSWHLPIADMSGMFLHRNYLCYILQPVWRNVRMRATVAVTADSIVTSAIVTQLSGMPPRYYPRRVVVESAPSKSSSTSSTAAAAVTATNLINNGKQMSPRAMLPSSLSSPLFSQQLLDSATTMEVMGYFGSMFVGPVEDWWCREGDDSSACIKNNNMGYSVPLFSSSLSLPWMTPGEEENKICRNN